MKVKEKYQVTHLDSEVCFSNDWRWLDCVDCAEADEVCLYQVCNSCGSEVEVSGATR